MVSFFGISHVRTAAKTLLGLLVGAVRSVDGCAASSVFVQHVGDKVVPTIVLSSFLRCGLLALIDPASSLKLHGIRAN